MRYRRSFSDWRFFFGFRCALFIVWFYLRFRNAYMDRRGTLWHVRLPYGFTFRVSMADRPGWLKYEYDTKQRAAGVYRIPCK